MQRQREQLRKVDNISYTTLIRSLGLRLKSIEENRERRSCGIGRVTAGEFRGLVGYYDPKQKMLWVDFPYVTCGYEVKNSHVSPAKVPEVNRYLELYCNKVNFNNIVYSAQERYGIRSVYV